MQKHRRKNMLVNKKIQLGLTLEILLALACYLLLFFVLTLFSPLSTLLSGGMTGVEVAAAKEEISYVVKVVLLPLAFAFVCIAIHGSLILHKLAGPLYRFNVVLDAMRGRDLTPMTRIRQGDYLQETSERFGLVLMKMSDDLRRARKDAQELLDQLLAQDPPDDEAVERCKAVLETIDGYKVLPAPEGETGGEAEAEPVPAAADTEETVGSAPADAVPEEEPADAKTT